MPKILLGSQSRWRYQPDGVVAPDPEWDVAWTPACDATLFSHHSYAAGMAGLALASSDSAGDGAIIGATQDPLWTWGTGPFTAIWYGVISSVITSGQSLYPCGSIVATNHFNMLLRSNGTVYSARVTGFSPSDYSIPINVPVMLVVSRDNSSNISIYYRTESGVYGTNSGTDATNYYLRLAHPMRASGINGHGFLGGTFMCAARRSNHPDLEELADNPWQVFRKRAGRLILIPSSGGGTTHTLTGAGSVVDSIAGAGSIIQTNALAGAGSVVDSIAGIGAVTQDHVLAGVGSVVDSIVGSGAVSQTHVLAGLGAVADTLAGTGAVVSGTTHVLTGSSGVADTLAGVGAITQTHVLAGTGATVDALAGAGAVSQTHILSGAGATIETLVALVSLRGALPKPNFPQVSSHSVAFNVTGRTPIYTIRRAD